MKIRIVDVRPFQAATDRGSMERRYAVFYSVDDGPVERLEVAKAELTQEDAVEAIKAHIAWKQSIIGTYEG